MSDLQCPARLWVVWSVVPDIDPRDLVPPEDPAAVVHPVAPGERVDLLELADRYRGEAVLLVVDRPPRQLPDLLPGDRTCVEVDSDGVRPASRR